MSPKAKSARPIAVYTRVSEQGRRSDEELLSHDLQRERIGRYLADNDLIPAPERFEDTDRSGGRMSRPAFDRAVAGVLEGRYGGMAVARLSRFARTTAAALDLIARIEEAGGAVIILDLKLDTSTAAGRAMLTVFLAFVTLEREQAIEQAGLVAEKKLRDGEALGGRAPVGYAFEVIGQDSNGKDRLGWLVPNGDAPVVVAAFEEFGSGASAGQVADLLNERGVLTSRGNRWKITSVRDLLGREVYAGVRRHGETRIEGAHEAIVPAMLWRRVQKRLAPKEGGVTRTRGEGHVLGEGLVRCGVCGKGLVVGNANGRYRTLRCQERGGGHPVIMYDRALEFVVSEAMRAVGWTMQHVGGNAEELAEAEAGLAQARAELAEVEALRGSVSPAAYAVALSDAQGAVEQAEDALAGLDRTEATIRFLTPLGTRQVFEALPVPEQRRALRSIIEKVVLSKQRGEARERLRIEFKDGSVAPEPEPDWQALAPGQAA